MKRLFDSRLLKSKKDFVPAFPIKVGMHVRGVVRTDARVMREAKTLVENGFLVSILDIEREKGSPSSDFFDGIEVKHFYKPHWHIPTRNLLRIVRSIEKFFLTTIGMIQMPVDIYHAHDVNALLPCWIAAVIHRKPLVFDAHELPLYELEHTRWPLLRPLMQCLLTCIMARCAGIITVSPPIIGEICRRYHISDVLLLRNIPAYQMVAKSHRLRQYLNLSQETRIALYQGNIQSDRRLDRLIRAAAFLDQNSVIVLMGKRVGTTPSELEALAIEAGVIDRIKIIEPVPYAELLDWTASADLGLIIYSPDHSLNVQMCLPNKLFEYLMAGLPVLSSPLEAVSDILTRYDVGQVVSSLSPEEIGMAINRMLSDHALVARQHHNALEIVHSQLCWENESQGLVQLYQNILATLHTSSDIPDHSSTKSSLEGAPHAHSLHL